jgi:hypothetical protein
MAYGALRQQELIELVRSHHPFMLEEEVRRALNRAQSDFSSRTECLTTVFKDTLITDQRYYRLGSNSNQADHPIIKIKVVDISNEVIPRFRGIPPIIDKDAV